MPIPSFAATTAPHPIARSPYPANGIARLGGSDFVSIPRVEGHSETPSVAVIQNGQPVAFPGNGWNDWKPGDDGLDSFVCVNAIHPYRGSLWCVDQGQAPGADTSFEAQKIVEIDPQSGGIRQILRFARDYMPEGATLNDLRIYEDLLFATDSGIGGVVIHNLATGETRRRLSQHPAARKPADQERKGTGGHPLAQADGTPPDPTQSDMLEVTPDGELFLWATPTGPIRAIPMEALLSDRSDEEIATEIFVYAQTPNIGGTAMDDRGNLYVSDIETRQVTVISSDGLSEVLVRDNRLKSPDALLIAEDRKLLIPCPQLEYLASTNGGTDGTEAPFEVMETDLPDHLGQIKLGDAIWPKA
ncbi:hypothetical protein [Thioclava kandeliae]|uniref:Major royal jelly protein n=1 Tax=Thioclava kandeliae TaxID=3070818 RepID=A0ABV1SE85_9RHOB